MNYLKTYINLCRKCKNNKKDSISYFERHHIFPQSIYGKNSLIVLMNAKEHFVAHFLLWKIYKKRYGFEDYRTIKMGYAFYKMNISSDNQVRYRSNSYKIIKEWYSKNNPSKYRDVSGEKNPMFGMTGIKHPLFGKPCSYERKEKIGNANRGRLLGDLNPSKRPEVKEKIRKNRKGISPFSGKTHPNYNKKISDEERQNLKIEWEQLKGTESLYKFCNRNSLFYPCSSSGIQSIVYKSPNT